MSVIADKLIESPALDSNVRSIGHLVHDDRIGRFILAFLY